MRLLKIQSLKMDQLGVRKGCLRPPQVAKALNVEKV